MIATILPGSTNFHAVGYNEHKVSTGSARRIEMKNFGALGMLEPPTPGELTDFLQGYSDRNKRISKAQFHVAFSCKGHEMTEEEILEFAHEWLSEMGYMKPGQPLLAYAHRDTDNTHIHIITSRVGPDGRKIEHDHERRRSQEIVDRLMKINRGAKIEKDIEAVKGYAFNSMAKFKALLSSLGYEVYVKEGNAYLKFGGRIRKKLDETEVTSWFNESRLSNDRRKQLRQIICKYRDRSTDKEELAKKLKKDFGIDLVFFGRKDHPFGYMLIDHSNKTVIHGNRILSLERLMDFATPEERLDRLEAFVEQLLKDSPLLSHSDLHEALSSQRAYIKKGVLYYNGTSRPLKKEAVDQIRRNNRIKWIESFSPRDDKERDLLCEFGKHIIDESVRPGIRLGTPSQTKYSDALTRLKAIADDWTIGNIKSALFQAGLIVRPNGEETFVVDVSNRTIVNLSSIGFDIAEIQRVHRLLQAEDIQKRLQQTAVVYGKKRHKQPMKGPRDIKAGSSYQNREWEVGNNGDYDRIDDASTLKR